jgi:hypothetical protein
MPKMRKEDTERIRKLIGEGLTNVEIHEQTGASESYIGKLKKEMNNGEVHSSPSIIHLSEKSQRNLILMQTAMGSKDVDSAIDKMYSDFLLINSKKIRFDPNNTMSVGEVFVKVVEELDSRVDIDDLLRRVRENDLQRDAMMMSLGWMM